RRQLFGILTFEPLTLLTRMQQSLDCFPKLSWVVALLAHLMTDVGRTCIAKQFIRRSAYPTVCHSVLVRFGAGKLSLESPPVTFSRHALRRQPRTLRLTRVNLFDLVRTGANLSITLCKSTSSCVATTF